MKGIGSNISAGTCYNPGFPSVVQGERAATRGARDKNKFNSSLDCVFF